LKINIVAKNAHIKVKTKHALKYNKFAKSKWLLEVGKDQIPTDPDGWIMLPK